MRDTRRGVANYSLTCEKANEAEMLYICTACTHSTALQLQRTFCGACTEKQNFDYTPSCVWIFVCLCRCRINVCSISVASFSQHRQIGIIISSSSIRGTYPCCARFRMCVCVCEAYICMCGAECRQLFGTGTDKRMKGIRYDDDCGIHSHSCTKWSPQCLYYEVITLFFGGALRPKTPMSARFGSHWIEHTFHYAKAHRKYTRDARNRAYVQCVGCTLPISIKK